MTTPSGLLFAPFVEFGFLRRALIATVALATGCGPIGTLLVLRRMSLVGDALSHAVLPGVAIGFLVGGLSLVAMGTGGLVAGLVVALLSGTVTRTTAAREDASFAAFYLIFLALGVLIVSTAGSSVDLLHVLFGTILAVDDSALLTVVGITTLTLLALAAFYRPLVIECFDPEFLSSVGARGSTHHSLFLVLLVLNLVSGFQALGTLMVVGLMMLPAAAARCWARNVWSLMLVSMLVATISGYVGLLVSYHFNLPSGPSIILTAGVFYVGSVVLGAHDSIRVRYLARVHFRT